MGRIECMGSEDLPVKATGAELPGHMAALYRALACLLPYEWMFTMPSVALRLRGNRLRKIPFWSFVVGPSSVWNLNASIGNSIAHILGYTLLARGCQVLIHLRSLW